MSKCTIKDISRMVGVSVGTVSRVLNNADNVDPELARRTMEAVKAANFVPSRRGPKPQSLRSPNAKRRPLVVVLAPEMSASWTGNVLWSEYLSGIEMACASRGAQYSILMAESLRPGARIDEFLNEGDGVLLKTPQADLSILSRIPKDIPLAGFGAFNAELKCPQTALDDHGAGRCAAEELLALGHKDIAFVSTMSANRMFISRGQGYAEAMKMAGIFKPQLLIEREDKRKNETTEPESSLPEMGWALDALLEASPKPTAAIFANDWIALGFCKACAERGVSAPKDISVVGIDGLKPFCEMSTPPLSSVEMPFAKTSSHAAETLLDLMEGRRGSGQSVSHMPVNFARRRSAIPAIPTPSRLQ